MATPNRPKNCYDLMKRLRGADLTLAQRAVLLAQYSYADRDGTNSYASEETLAEDLGIGVRMVRRHRQALRDSGWLVLRRRGRNVVGGDATASVYEVTIPDESTGHKVPPAQQEPHAPKAQDSTGHKVPPTRPYRAEGLRPSAFRGFGGRDKGGNVTAGGEPDGSTSGCPECGGGPEGHGHGCTRDPWRKR